jgi:phosphoglycerol transferase MdoB-like AlkP superfamily enzyme
MYAAMTLVQIIALFVLWIALTLLWYRIYKKIFAEKKDALSKLNWGTLPLMLFLTSLLILPIRGGTNTSPLNYSSVYFSDNLQANQSAYNFFWNLFYTLTQDKFKHNPVSYMKAGEAQKIVESSYDAKEEFPSYISTNNNKPVNVIVIILESFSGKIVGPEGDYKNATPNLNEVCKNGIFFNNFFATGNRSDKGICALIGGYPSVINGTTRLSSPEKMRKLFYFPKHFKEHGYSLSFFYGGDINFYNTKTALIQSGFDKMISNISFSKDIASLQKWGVPDEHLYNRTFEELKNQKQPFLSMIYNISSHDPFDVPFHKIKGDDRPSKYFNSIAYSDSCLGVFIRKLKASPLWENTLVVITADHCTPLPDQSSIESPRSYRIPLLWTGGVVKQSFICNNFAMQNDLGPTLLQQMGWAVKYPTFSKNIFSKRNYAFYFRDAGWGFVSPKAQFFQNINNRKLDVFHMEPKQNSDSIINFAKAYVQFLHDDFIKN